VKAGDVRYYLHDLLVTRSPNIRLEGMILNSRVAPIEMKNWAIPRMRARDPPPPGWFPTMAIQKLGPAVRARVTRRKSNRIVSGCDVGMYENSASVARIIHVKDSKQAGRVASLQLVQYTIRA
jgi:hypothetical protein